jgi:hypothetical protein
MDGSDGEERDGRGVHTTSTDVSFRSGRWREREIVESAVIVTEPRAADKQDRDDGDSGISETAVEERLLPPASPAGTADKGLEYGGSGKKESILETLIQVFIPFMIAGFGMMAAGLLLDAVQVSIRVKKRLPVPLSSLCLSVSGSTGTCTSTSMRYSSLFRLCWG